MECEVTIILQLELKILLSVPGADSVLLTLSRLMSSAAESPNTLWQTEAVRPQRGPPNARPGKNSSCPTPTAAAGILKWYKSVSTSEVYLKQKDLVFNDWCSEWRAYNSLHKNKPISSPFPQESTLTNWHLPIICKQASSLCKSSGLGAVGDTQEYKPILTSGFLINKRHKTLHVNRAPWKLQMKNTLILSKGRHPPQTREYSPVMRPIHSRDWESLISQREKEQLRLSPSARK